MSLGEMFSTLHPSVSSVLFLYCLQLKEETEATRKALSALVEGNLNANERMNSIRTPWREKLQDMVAQLNDLFRE